jgi:hypothetical protein
MKKISPLSKCKNLNPSEKEANNRSVKFKSLREGNRRSEKDPWVAELYRVDGRPSKRVMETLAWS